MSQYKRPEYLGDGLYAEFNSHQIILKANNHENPTDTVYLEAEVVQRLLEYLSKNRHPAMKLENLRRLALDTATPSG